MNLYRYHILWYASCRLYCILLNKTVRSVLKKILRNVSQQPAEFTLGYAQIPATLVLDAIVKVGTNIGEREIFLSNQINK